MPKEKFEGLTYAEYEKELESYALLAQDEREGYLELIQNSNEGSTILCAMQEEFGKLNYKQLEYLYEAVLDRNFTKYQKYLEY